MSIAHSLYMSNKIEETHKGAFYQCDQCNYKASKKTSLQKLCKGNQIRDAYSCDYCDYKATEMAVYRNTLILFIEGFAVHVRTADTRPHRRTFLNYM